MESAFNDEDYFYLEKQLTIYLNLELNRYFDDYFKEKKYNINYFNFNLYKYPDLNINWAFNINYINNINNGDISTSKLIKVNIFSFN